MFGRDEKVSAVRLTGAQYLILGIFLILAYGLWRLQVMQSDYYSLAAEKNRIRNVPVLAPRGKILDRNGRVIVDNYPSFSALLLRDSSRDLAADADLIEKAAELRRLLEVGMVAEFVAQIPIEPKEMEEVIPLEDSVMLDDPVIFLRYKWLHDSCRDIGVIRGSQRIADIVQQGTDHIFLVPARLIRAGCGLQAMLQTIDREPAIVALEQLQMRNQTIGKFLPKAL